MKQMGIMIIVLSVLFLLSTSVLAGMPVNSDERFTFLGERNGFYYFGWADDTNEQNAKSLWVKIIPGDLGRKLLNEHGGPDSNLAIQDIDSILCQIDVSEGKFIYVVMQIYYDQSGITIAKWPDSDRTGQIDKSIVDFIAGECANFLTGYFSFK